MSSVETIPSGFAVVTLSHRNYLVPKYLVPALELANSRAISHESKGVVGVGLFLALLLYFLRIP